jgi:hypothetical protein
VHRSPSRLRPARPSLSRLRLQLASVRLQVRCPMRASTHLAAPWSPIRARCARPVASVLPLPATAPRPVLLRAASALPPFTVLLPAASVLHRAALPRAVSAPLRRATVLLPVGRLPVALVLLRVAQLLAGSVLLLVGRLPVALVLLRVGHLLAVSRLLSRARLGRLPVQGSLTAIQAGRLPAQPSQDTANRRVATAHRVQRQAATARPRLMRRTPAGVRSRAQRPWFARAVPRGPLAKSATR